MQTALVLPFFLLLSVIVISTASLAAIHLWSTARRREREAFYRTEAIKLLTEARDDGGTDVLQFLRLEDENQASVRRERARLAGLVTGLIGLALMIFLFAVLHRSTSQPVFLVALIPIFAGAAFLLHSISGRSK